MEMFNLFKPAWKSENDSKAQNAVLKINDQVLLQKIYTELNAELINSTDGKIGASGVLRLVVSKLADQNMLADIAKNHKDIDVRCKAVGKLTDQTALADYAKNDDHYHVRLAAIYALVDQNVLTDIEKNDPRWDIREAATERLFELNNPGKKSDRVIAMENMMDNAIAFANAYNKNANG